MLLACPLGTVFCLGLFKAKELFYHRGHRGHREELLGKGVLPRRSIEKCFKVLLWFLLFLGALCVLGGEIHF